MPPAQLLRFDSYPGHIVQENSKYARILGVPRQKEHRPLRRTRRQFGHSGGKVYRSGHHRIVIDADRGRALPVPRQHSIDTLAA